MGQANICTHAPQYATKWTCLRHYIEDVNKRIDSPFCRDHWVGWTPSFDLEWILKVNLCRLLLSYFAWLQIKFILIHFQKTTKKKDDIPFVICKPIHTMNPEPENPKYFGLPDPTE